MAGEIYREESHSARRSSTAARSGPRSGRHCSPLTARAGDGGASDESDASTPTELAQPAIFVVNTRRAAVGELGTVRRRCWGTAWEFVAALWRSLSSRRRAGARRRRGRMIERSPGCHARRAFGRAQGGRALGWLPVNGPSVWCCRAPGLSPTSTTSGRRKWRTGWKTCFPLRDDGADPEPLLESSCGKSSSVRRRSPSSRA
jgi:hypothetical protein